MRTSIIRNGVGLTFGALLFFATVPQAGRAQPAPFAAGALVEGHVGSKWVSCTVVRSDPFGGYVLRCDALPGQESVFSETDVRVIRAPHAPHAPQVKKAQVAAVAANANAHRVEGRVGSKWIPCTVVRPEPFGGFTLHCDSLPQDESVFAASDVREIGAPPAKPQERPVAAANAHRVEGRVGSKWIPCAVVRPEPFGGFVLHCDSLPQDESVFAASDVREIGAPPAKPQQRPVPAADAHRVEGRVGSNWVPCTVVRPEPFGGFVLHCDSLPQDESVFAASDVREIGAPPHP
jgi:hypothetical protein